MKVGDDKLAKPNDVEVDIEIPHEHLITEFGDPLEAIVNCICPSLSGKFKDPRFIKKKKREIWSPTHDLVQNVNDYMLSLTLKGGENVF